MPVILHTENRNIKTRLIVAGMFLLLTCGAITMVHPFLVMLSGSLKSNLDQYDFDVFPRFLHDDALLLRKHTESKCNESIALFKGNYGVDTITFRDAAPPAPATGRLLEDWERFRGRELPSLYYMLGFTAPSQRTVPANVRRFRAHLRGLCDNDLDLFASRFGTVAEHWGQIYVPYEQPLARTYQLSREPFLVAYQAFKQARPAEERIFISCQGQYARFLKALGAYESDIGRYNSRHGTAYGAFEEIPFPATAPAEAASRRDWEEFVRRTLNCAFITVADSARPGYAAFLKQRHGGIGSLNKSRGTAYRSFDEVPFPADRSHAGKALADYALFLQDAAHCPADAIAIDSAEFRWRAFLLETHGSLAALRAAHGRAYPTLEDIAMPQWEADAAYVRAHAGALRREFAARNYRTVFEYLAVNGRGLVNTVIYCLLAVAVALIVNPIAAYALSRYRMPSQYKILLFLMATMTFPQIVTTIPNFLMLKELGLLNTFAALLLPGMANGYSIFLLKGFFDSLPREIYEAADIDGATEWQKFWVITMNLSKPILAVIALGAFTGAYGNFMFAFIVCQDRSMWTLMVWLYQLQQFAGQEVIFASLIIAAVPTLLVFTFCQNLIIRGIVVPTEK